MKKKFSLRIELIATLLVFVAIILGVIYIFQTHFLEDFYRRNKIKMIESVADSVSYSITNDEYEEILDEMSMANEVCVRLVSNDSDYNVVGGCALRNLDFETINMIGNEVKMNGGSMVFDQFQYHILFDQRGANIYIYAKMIEYNDSNIMILVSSMITPLDATISTLKSQYVIIAIIVIVATIILALFISRFIVKPIKDINEESKNLSTGKYEGDNIKTHGLEFSELNESLVKANEDILKADKAKKELLGNVSHDLRTPLTMIVGYGEMIRDLPEENTEDNINVIIDEAKRLSTLVDDLIDISKLEASRIELHKEVISLNGLLESVYRQYEKYCESQGVSLKLKTLKDMDVLLDEHRIKQVLYNFINNALNYADKKKQKIELGVMKLDEGYRVYVYDNGQGIDEKDLANIWERYYKVDKEHKRQHIGSGIGLSLSKELLEAHGLAYGVESKKDEYSRFYFDVKEYEH